MPTYSKTKAPYWIAGTIVVCLVLFWAMNTYAQAQDTLFVTPTAKPTLGNQIVDYALAMLSAVVSAVALWLGSQVSSWLTQKHLVTKTQADTLIGANMDLVARKAIEFAKTSLGPKAAEAIDEVTSQNMLVKMAASYAWPKLQESLDHFGFSPQDLEDFIRARLNLPPEPHPAVVVATTTLPAGSPVLRS